MKTLEIKINNFGKFSNQNFNFDEKLNIIDKPNGYGKTTLANFISAIFYGMPNHIKSQGTKNMRIKYIPWQGGRYGGSIVFKYLSKTYEVFREFDDKGSKDKFELLNYDTKVEVTSIKDIKVDPKTFGELIFNINQNSFENTNFIPQSNMTYYDKDEKIEDDINIKLRELFGDTSDDNDYQKALNILTKAENQLKPSKKDGEYYRLEENINKLNNSRIKSINAKDELVEQNEILLNLKTSQAKIDDEIKNVKIKIDEVNTYNEKKLRKETYVKNIESLKNFEEQLKNNLKIFIRQTPENTNLENLKKNLNTFKEESITKNLKIDNFNKEIQELKFKQASSKSVSIMIDNLKSDLTQNNLQLSDLVNKKSNIKLKPLKLIDVILSIITLGIYFFIFKNKNKEINNELKLINNQISNLENQIKLNNDKLKNLEKDDNLNLDDEILKLENKKSLISNDFIELENKIKKDFIDYDVDLNNLDVAYYLIETSHNKHFELLKSINQIKLEIKEEDKNIEVKELNYNIDLLSNQEKLLNSNLIELVKKINTLEKEIELNEELSSELDFYQEEINNLQEIKKEYDVKRVQIELAKKHLLESSQVLASRYLQPLGDEINKLIQDFDLRNLIIKFDGNSKMLVKEENNNNLYDLSYYSTGSIDLISFLTRVALINIIYKDINPFIVLDDPFVNFDDEKIKIVKPLLKKLSSKYQIIYLTCSSSRNLSV